MGNTVESARFRGMVQILGERKLVEEAEIQAIWTEFWTLRLESAEDFYSKFSPQDARDICETGNGFFLVEQALEKLPVSKTACRVLSRLMPAFLGSNVSLPSVELVVPSITNALCEDGIGFDKDREDEEKDVLWARFPFDHGSPQDSHQLDENRIELLRCLNVALSEPLFTKAESPGEAFMYCFDGLLGPSMKIESITERGTSLLVSMLAAITENHKRRQELVRHCINVVAVMLDTKQGEPNALVYVLSNLPMLARRTLIRCIVEKLRTDLQNSVTLLCLLWRLLDSSFMLDALVEEEPSLAVLVFELSALLFSLRRGDDPRKHSKIQMASILWFVLSCDRRVGLVLNRNPAVPKGSNAPSGFPAILSKDWTLMDFTFTCALRFVSEGHSAIFEPLMRLCLTGLINYSWYIKSLHAYPSTALVDVLEQRYCKPRFLLARESNHMFLKNVLEIISNVLQYQSQGNSRLIYALMRSRHVFVALQEWEPDIADDNGKHQHGPINGDKADSGEPEDEGIRTDKQASDERAHERFAATRAWFDDWKQSLPLTAILLTIKELGPKLDLVVSANEADYLEIIEGTTLVGALPAPPPIVISKYARSDKIDAVVRRALWVDFFRSDDYLDLWRVPDLPRARSRRDYEEV